MESTERCDAVGVGDVPDVRLDPLDRVQELGMSTGMASKVELTQLIAVAPRARWCRLTLLGLVGGLVLLVGCESSGSNQKVDVSAPSSAVQHPLLTGVPLPRGFTAKDSFARETGELRIARYTFVGGWTTGQVHDFMLEHMPTAGYRLLERRDEDGEFWLRYQSGQEEVALRIGPEGFGKSYLKVDLGPRPDAAVPGRQAGSTAPRQTGGR